MSLTKLTSKLVVLIGVLLSGASKAEENSSVKDFIYCKKNGFVRTIRSEVGKDGVCSAFYTKSGVDELVGSMRDSKGCQNIIKNIKKNLLQGSWQCKDSTNTKVSDSTKINSAGADKTKVE